MFFLLPQEKDLIWQIREYCLTNLPELLPRIIDCVDYTNQNQVFALHALLERWPVLPAERALQLLDYAYPDEFVRRFAVKCLREVNDDILLRYFSGAVSFPFFLIAYFLFCRYLLQLAQTLKHESYFQSDLVELLLERALTNQHIGHYLFWELKVSLWRF